MGRHHRRRTATDPTIQGDDMNPYKVEMFLDKANQWYVAVEVEE